MNDQTSTLLNWIELLLAEGPTPIEAQLLGRDPWNLLSDLAATLRSLFSPTPLEELRARYPGVWFDQQGWYAVGSGAEIEPGSFLSGTVVLSKTALVRHSAYLRGAVYLGEGAVAGHATELKNSLLMAGAAAAHFNYVGDSILGAGANLGAGAICANLRLDRAPVRVRLGSLSYASSLRKFGALVGAGSQIGCHAVLSPGTVLGRDVWVGPGLSLRGFYESGSRILSLEGRHASSR